MPLMNRERWNLLGLAVFGGTYGALLDYAHTHGGVIEYPPGTTHERGILTFALVYSVAPWLTSQWRMFTEKFVVVTYLPSTPGTEEEDATKPKKDTRIFRRANEIPPVHAPIIAMGLFYTSGYLLTAYGWKHVPSLAIAGVLGGMSASFWFAWDRTWSGLASVIAVGLLGTSTEAFLNTHVQSMTYQVNEIGGVPIWLFFLYTAGTSMYGQITRRLLEPQHDIPLFIGAESLPNAYARARYAMKS